MRTIALSMVSLLMLTACSLRQQLITGEPLVFGFDTRSGAVVDRDLLGQQAASGGTGPTTAATVPQIPHQGEIIAIVVNNVFLRYLKALASPHVLVYAEVFDDGQDDPTTAITKVLFNEQDQPPGVNLGLADRLLYGPTPYKGFPIRMKFNIIELDKDNKRTASRLLNAAGKVGAAIQPQAAPAVGVVVQVAELINELNKDDFELRFDLTLYPVATSGTADVGDKSLTGPHRQQPEPIQRHGKPFSMVSTLQVGSYVVIKRDVEQITRLLDNPGQMPLSERIGPKVDELAGSILVVLEGRRIAEMGSRRVGRDPQFRTSAEYPYFWISQIEPLAGLIAASAAHRNAVAKNAAVLPTLSDLVMNLPPLRPEHEKEMRALRGLDRSVFEAVPDRPGLFKLSAAGLQALNAARN